MGHLDEDDPFDYLDNVSSTNIVPNGNATTPPSSSVVQQHKNADSSSSRNITTSGPGSNPGSATIEASYSSMSPMVHADSYNDELKESTASSGGIANPDAAPRPPSKGHLWRIRSVIQKFNSSSMSSKLLMLTVLVQSILVSSLEGALFSLFQTSVQNVDYSASSSASASASSIPVYLIIFLLANVFQMFAVLDAVYFKNILEVIAFSIFNLLLFVYSIFQIFQIRDFCSSQYALYDDPNNMVTVSFSGFSPILITIAALFAFFQVIYTILTLKLHQEYGWELYNTIGGDIQMLNMHKLIETFVVLIKFCSFFSIGFLLQYAILILSNSDGEKVVSFIAIPVIVFILVFTIRCIKKENRILAISSMILQLLGLVYFLFKLGRIYTDIPKFSPFIKFLTFFDILSIISLVLTLTVTFRCYWNFGKGIKERAQLVALEKRQSKIKLETA